MEKIEDSYNKTTKNFEVDLTNAKRTLNSAFCLICRKSVGLIHFSQSIRSFKNSQRIEQFIRNRQIHLLHNFKGLVMFCEDSVREAFQNMPTQRLDTNLFKTNPSHQEINISSMR